ncbi:hypothetical protein [Arsenophonus nasoniae]|uniref:Uncharacterized protein n=1 Tax=Arsenophonus nasoniae TaxID=638 RepID=A0ABY8NZ37_9GAMM|nr:hypothetical protein [Arsenophonus nasoniae]WGM08979.1 hypothetical protein QE258_26850 [Arsenophonus nasoniae]
MTEQRERTGEEAEDNRKLKGARTLENPQGTPLLKKHLIISEFMPHLRLYSEFGHADEGLNCVRFEQITRLFDSVLHRQARGR